VYQIFGLPLLLRVFAWLVSALAFVVAAVTLLMEVPTGFGWAKLALSAISTSVFIGMLFVAVLANGRAFPWCCRLRWARGLVPDLAGEWVGELQSNWPRISAREAENVGDIALLPRPAKAKFTANLFTVCMELVTDDRYSKSRTFATSLTKDPTTGNILLSYLYENETLDPKSSDVSIHQGAAKLALRREGNELILEGPYWTNRAWNKGLNTAGIAIFRKEISG